MSEENDIQYNNILFALNEVLSFIDTTLDSDITSENQAEFEALFHDFSLQLEGYLHKTDTLREIVQEQLRKDSKELSSEEREIKVEERFEEHLSIMLNNINFSLLGEAN